MTKNEVAIAAQSKGQQLKAVQKENGRLRNVLQNAALDFEKQAVTLNALTESLVHARRTIVQLTPKTPEVIPQTPEVVPPAIAPNSSEGTTEASASDTEGD